MAYQLPATISIVKAARFHNICTRTLRRWVSADSGLRFENSWLLSVWDV